MLNNTMPAAATYTDISSIVWRWDQNLSLWKTGDESNLFYMYLDSDGNNHLVNPEFITGPITTESSGSSGNIILTENPGDITVNGHPLITDIHGVSGLVIIGSSASDTLQGGNRDDAIGGGNGYDKLYGNEGNDILSGGNGNDTLSGGAGEDYLDGGSGSDTVDYSTSNAGVSVTLLANGSMVGEGGDATGDTGINIENIIGSGYNDTLSGSDADNNIRGGNGNDVISGGNGTDSLNGQNGNDTIIGGKGFDILVGGAGADRFVYQNSTDSTHAERDVILDFGNGKDKIDLSALKDIGIKSIADLTIRTTGNHSETIITARDTAIDFQINLEWQTLHTGDLQTPAALNADHFVFGIG